MGKGQAVNKLPQVQVLSLFDRSGVMIKPWVDAGYTAATIDLEPARHDGLHLQSDARDLLVEGSPLVVFAFPPCTHLAGSGARWWESKGPEALADALDLVSMACRVAALARDWWMLENPVGRLSTHWGPPAWTFDPHEYAGLADDPSSEAYTKRTCLWTNFSKPSMSSVDPVLGSAMHKIGPGPDRAFLRSITPTGFARAIFAHLEGRRPLLNTCPRPPICPATPS